MTEIEVPVEHIQEEIHHQAEHSGSRWIARVALSSALLAALAAVAALIAGHHSNEAMLEQIQASDQWSYYQAKGVKSSLLGTKIAVLEALGKSIAPKDTEKLQDYKKEQEEISKIAQEKEHASKHHLHTHEILARAVTFFQVAIALSAISVLTKRRRFWFVSLGFGAIGAISLIQGLLS